MHEILHVLGLCPENVTLTGLALYENFYFVFTEIREVLRNILSIVYV